MKHATPLHLMAPKRLSGGHADAHIHCQPALACLWRSAEKAQSATHQALNEHGLLHGWVGHQILGRARFQWLDHLALHPLDELGLASL